MASCEIREVSSQALISVNNIHHRRTTFRQRLEIHDIVSYSYSEDNVPYRRIRVVMLMLSVFARIN